VINGGGDPASRGVQCVESTKVTLVLDIDEPELRVALLRLDVDRRERRRTREQCIWEAYDLMAGKLISHGTHLTDQERRRDIPGKVLEAAVKYRWTDHPEYRRQRAVRYRSVPRDPALGAINNSSFIAIAEAERTEQLGAFRVTPSYLKWWLDVLGGRIRTWEANSLDVARAEKIRAANPSPVRGERTADAPLISSDLPNMGKQAHEKSDTRGGLLADETRPVLPTAKIPTRSSKAHRAARGAILKRYKVKKQLTTMDDLARNLHISRATLYGMRAGDTKRYGDEKLASFLENIGCSRSVWDFDPDAAENS
jgi:hypothetical protein